MNEDENKQHNAERDIRQENLDGVREIQADDKFEQEVAKLGSSIPFIQFLAARAKQRKGRSLEEVEQALNLRPNQKP